MSFRGSNDAINGGGLFQEAGSGLMRIAGGWSNFPGPGIFMVRTIISGTTSAIAFGLAGSGIAAALFGSASLPFLILACCGFAFGTLGFYKNALHRSMIALERYPRLMQLHLDANYPGRGFLRYGQIELRREAFNKSWILRSMLVCSWLTAQPALDQMLESQEQILTIEGGETNKTSAELDEG